jgi:hypothetical protein
VPLWALDNHPFIPRGLTGIPLREHTELAERVLGLRTADGPVLTLDPTADAAVIADLKRFLALQVSLQNAQSPEAFLAESVGRGTETISYRDGVAIHPISAAGVQAILDEYAGSGEITGTAWPIVGGWRS